MTSTSMLRMSVPIAMSVVSFSTAPTETATSGALVPNATIVSPTTSEDTPSERASFDAPRTSASAPATSATRPSAKKMAWTNIH